MYSNFQVGLFVLGIMIVVAASAFSPEQNNEAVLPETYRHFNNHRCQAYFINKDEVVAVTGITYEPHNTTGIMARYQTKYGALYSSHFKDLECYHDSD